MENKFNNSFWSLYNIDGSILTSLFYHDLHIAQMKALYDLFEIEEFKDILCIWSRKRNNFIYRKWAFIFKVCQKLRE